ncbi:ATP-binding protein [Falsirhodobacter sp. 1013]|uniref:PAS domain-containing sensor histidine kinase n=1 Tax=Falsirhodobacter sp. 1013 TaxID=3417566 RepID=UPI003EB7EFA7
MASDVETTQLQELLDTAPCGFLVMDETGRIVTANATLKSWLGASDHGLQGKPATGIFSVGARIVFETSLLPVLRLRGQIEEVSLDLRAQDGSKVPVLLSADNTDDGQHRLTRLVFLRAKARRNYERELISARAEAEARLSLEQRQGELREQFVAVLGHDLRNPVASMSAATRMLSREDLSEPGKEVIRLMQGSVQRMSRLIDNVLDFARNRLGGGIELNISNEPLEVLIRQVVDELRSGEPDRDVQTNFSILHAVTYDGERIGQMVSNLVGNALIHGDPAHPVLVSAQTREDGHLEIWVSNKGNTIPPTAMEKLFDPFVRGGAEGYRKGLGLGLHIASEIARAHGGQLLVSSTDQETRFTFRMTEQANAV